MFRLFFVLMAMALASLACSVNVDLPDIPKLKTGPTETFTLAEPLPDVKGATNVTLNMGAGKLNVTPGGTGLISGTVQYNIAEWKPELTRSDSALRLTQGKVKDSLGFPNSDTKLVNDWDIQLGPALLDLKIDAGAYKGVLELGGLKLQNLEINDGASDTEVNFSEPNPEPMSKFSYNTGASNVTLTGLANANFAEMEFSGGAGSYSFDFSGELQREALVNFTSAASDMEIIIPEGTNATVEVTGGLLNVSTKGKWQQQDDMYTATGGSGPLLKITVSLGAGSLTLIHK